MIYEIKIDRNNIDPDTNIIFDNTIKDFDNMPIFKDIKPCVLKNGKVEYYLNKNNFLLKENGEQAVLSGEDGDIMIEFPNFGYLITKDEDYITVKVTEEANKEDFVYYAFSKDNYNDCDYFYYGAYKASFKEDILSSIPNAESASRLTLEQFVKEAAKKGDNYTITNFFPLTAIICLYLIKYHNLDGQKALGFGATDLEGSILTGGTETLGMDYGVNNYSNHVKLFGIEDFWGNIWEWVDGCHTDDNFNFITSFGNEIFTTESNLSLWSLGYITDISATNESGFLPIEFDNGRSDINYCDHGDINANKIMMFGGCWGCENKSGPFNTIIGCDREIFGFANGARLMYFHQKEVNN